MGLLKHIETLQARSNLPQDLISGSVSHASYQSVLSVSMRLNMPWAVLFPFGNRYCISHQDFFDIESIFKSVSSADFWNGILKTKKEWQFFTGKELSPFYQLFSDRMKNNLTQLYVKSFVILSDIPVTAIMIVLPEHYADFPETICEHLIQYIADDISTYPRNTCRNQEPLPEKINFRLFKFSIKNILESYIKDMNIDIEAAAKLTEVIFTSISNKLRSVLPDFSCCRNDDDGTFSIGCNQCSTLDTDLFQFLLQQKFLTFFPAGTQITVQDCGTALSKKQLDTFLYPVNNV